MPDAQPGLKIIKSRRSLVKISFNDKHSERRFGTLCIIARADGPEVQRALTPGRLD